MNPIIKNILAVLAGLVVGSFVNMGIIMLSGSIIPPPPGADLTTPEGLKAAMPLMEAKHFIMPFLAHALGSLVGAFLAVKLGAKLSLGFVVAGFFMLGGLANIFMLPSPLWFTILDLAAAYIPMGYLGGKLALGKAQ